MCGTLEFKTMAILYVHFAFNSVMNARKSVYRVVVFKRVLCCEWEKSELPPFEIGEKSTIIPSANTEVLDDWKWKTFLLSLLSFCIMCGRCSFVAAIVLVVGSLRYRIYFK